MLLSLRVNNCLIYNSEVEFSMKADMRYKRFPNNVASFESVNALKSAVLIGPNNSGKTNFVKVIAGLKWLMLGKGMRIRKNLFSNNPIVEYGVSFIENEIECLFETKYDVTKKEFIYERFAQVSRDKYKNEKIEDQLIRDSINKKYYANDEVLEKVMKLASKNNILIYLIDNETFPCLKMIKETIVSFASKIDILDMNNIPINKTIELLKKSESAKKKIVDFIINADLSLEDYKYLNDDEVQIELKHGTSEPIKPQENALNATSPLSEMLHLASVYKGVTVPSMLYDSTGTKKMAALASYVIDALENGRILVVDELDNSLHFRLTRAIIALFNNELNNNSQLIATVHDVSLLDCQKLFRKEQIWFTYKDKENAYLYSLSEFTAEKDGVRETSNLIEKYRNGMFGALPEPDLFQSLLEVSQNG